MSTKISLAEFIKRFCNDTEDNKENVFTHGAISAAAKVMELSPQHLSNAIKQNRQVFIFLDETGVFIRAIEIKPFPLFTKQSKS